MTTTGIPLGTKKYAKEPGKNNKQGFIYVECPMCHKQRWKMIVGNNKTNTCRKCYIEATHHRPSNRSNGGKFKTRGYVCVLLRPDDFFYSMGDKKGYVREHRLVMAKSLNRCLLPEEVVHHKNGIKDDNRLENLALLASNSEHNKAINKEVKKLRLQVEQLQQRVSLLEVENILMGAKAKGVMVCQPH